MSLIADALKAAQGESGGARAESGASRRAIAASVLGRESSGRRGIGGTPLKVPRPVGFATAVLSVALLGAVTMVAIAPSGDPLPMEPRASAGASMREALQTAAVSPAPTADAPVEEAAPADEPADTTASVVAAAGEMAERIPGALRALATQIARTAESRVAPRTGDPAAAPAARTGPPRVVERDGGRFQLTVQPPPAAGDLLASAVAAHRGNDLLTAVRLYREVLARDPRDAAALNNLGAAYQALGEHASARDAFRRAVELDARDAVAWSSLGAALGALGQGDEAQAALGEAIRLDPSNQGARVNLANHYLSRGLAADARRLLEEVVAADPTHAEARYGLARILESQGDRAGAVRHYRAFLEHGQGRFPQLDDAVRTRIQQLGG